MADLVIRGMEMPTNVYDCPLNTFGFCNLAHDSNHIYCIGDSRPEWCPLVPLPEGHGRLIDADKLADDLQFDVEYDQRALDDLNIVGIERERIQFDKDCKQNCMWYLTKCQAVVPAEGGTDDGN